MAPFPDAVAKKLEKLDKIVKKQDAIGEPAAPKKSVADDFMAMKRGGEEETVARPKPEEPKLDRKAINAALRAPLPEIPSRSGAKKPQNSAATPSNQSS